MFRRLLDAVFPRSCLSCGRGPWPFCADCAAALRPLEPPWCTRCGAPAGVPTTACGSCPPEPLAVVRSAFVFDGPIRDAILRMKFGGDRGAARELGRAASRVAPAVPDAVTWVPLSRRRRGERGFDQAQLLAVAVAHDLGVAPRGLLRRVRDLPPQARRGAAERRTALGGAFATVTEAPAHVLLVDDVLTTGATAAECARQLIDAGARRVDVCTVARSLRLLSSLGLQTGSVVAREDFSR